MSLLLQICQELHIDLEMLKSGYDKIIHRLKIGEAITKNVLKLPKTKQLIRIESEYRNNSKYSETIKSV